MPSKEFHELIDKCKAIHNSKSHDYASEDNSFSNFEQAAFIVGLFNKPIDQVFAGIIGIKVSRLGQLLNGKIPKNESIEDSFIDLSNYSLLWAAYHKRENDKAKSNNKVNEANKYKPINEPMIYDDKIPGFKCNECGKEFHGRVPIRVIINEATKLFCTPKCNKDYLFQQR